MNTSSKTDTYSGRDFAEIPIFTENQKNKAVFTEKISNSMYHMTSPKACPPQTAAPVLKCWTSLSNAGTEVSAQNHLQTPQLQKSGGHSAAGTRAGPQELETKGLV